MTEEEDWDSVESSLFSAVINRNVEQVKSLLRQNPETDINLEEQGKTPLHIAVENGQGEMVRLLVSCGADIFAENSSKNTPMDIARAQEYHEIERLLYMMETTAWRPGMDPDLLQTPICKDYLEPRVKSNLIMEQSQISLLLQDEEELKEYYTNFENHNITFIQFLRLDDDCLQKIGISDPNHREKLLKIIKDVAERKWQPGSVLPNFMEKNLTPSETICMLNNLQGHTQLMCSSVNLLRTKIMNKPNTLLHGVDSVSMKDLISAVDKTTIEAKTLSQNVQIFADSVAIDFQNDEDNQSKNNGTIYQSTGFKVSIIGCCVMLVAAAAFMYQSKRK